MRYRYIDDDDRGRRFTFKVSRKSRPLSPEHEEIIRRVERRQLEESLTQSAERRRKLGLPERDYGPPPAT